MKCPQVTAGWQERVQAKLQLAAGAGLLGGSLYAVMRNGPYLRWALATSVSCVLCEATFCGFQELVRSLRCHVSPVNSVIAGGTAGYLLTALHMGPQRALPAAFALSGICGLADVVSEWADAPSIWRTMLVSLDLLDDPEGPPQQQQSNSHSHSTVPAPQAKQPAEMNQADASEQGPQSWRDWMPIRQLSEEEWQEYKSKKAADFQARIDRVTKPKEPPDTHSS